MEKTYKTNEIAKIIGIHPNTVRMYEDLGLISKTIRQRNGYRMFTELHVDQFRLARTAFQIEVLQNGLRQKAVFIVKLSALCKFDEAIKMTEEYIALVQIENKNANEAVKIVKELLSRSNYENIYNLKRKEVSDMLGVTIDTLRNWEINGLLKVKRKENGYRVYTDADVQKLKIIRSLKCANYSLSAILRMMNELDRNAEADIQTLLDVPKESEDIVSVCDKLVVSLNNVKDNAEIIKLMLYEMKNKYSNPPL